MKRAIDMRLRVTACAGGLLLASAAAQAQTSRLSIDSNELPADNDSHEPSISNDGRYIAFYSLASNLVAGDTNGNWDVFVRDRIAGTTERVSVDSGGAQGNERSFWHALSGDGRFVAFSSLASNFAAGDTSVYFDVFVRDRFLGTTELVSVGAGGVHGIGQSYKPAISGDGRFVAFESGAHNWGFSDLNNNLDVFVRDRLLGTTELVSRDAGGAAGNAVSSGISISADGRFVSFRSAASNLVPGDTNAKVDVFVRDRLLGSTERVSVDSAGIEGNDASDASSVSDDGRYVVFDSSSSNLVAGDTNQTWDVFLRDRLLLTTDRLTLGLGGAQANGQCHRPRMTGDGRHVAYDSTATNLVAWDVNLAADVFLHDRSSGTTELVSRTSSGGESNGWSLFAAPSSDGRYVTFESGASNLDPGDLSWTQDVFVRDRATPGPASFCFGDGSLATCPCGNNSFPGYGCENSGLTGGAVLSSIGCPSLASDTLVLTSTGELDQVLSIFLQGDAAISATHFGDGLRCAGGTLKRLYIRNAVGGIVTAPIAGEPSISARSASLGDVIPVGSMRHYQAYYRDPSTGFCPPPTGSSWNISAGISVAWAQ